MTKETMNYDSDELKPAFHNISQAWGVVHEFFSKHDNSCDAAIEYLKQNAPRNQGKTVCALTGEMKSCTDCIADSSPWFFDCPVAFLGPMVK